MAAIQVLTFFFLEDSSTSFSICLLIIIIGSGSGDKSNVTYNWGLQKGVREAKSLGTFAIEYSLPT